MSITDHADHGVPAVAAVTALFSELLAQADQIKPTRDIEPPLERADLGNPSERLGIIFGPVEPAAQSTESIPASQARTRQYAIIETAVRDLFARLLATISIDTPEFVRVWNLFDILSILSDDERCEPALLFWIIEELFDSQTIAGCQKILDYLESRRERITAKHFKQKQLVILRTCNELLRRLSRAENTGFCGRVFIFMFQSFPLGDRGLVNLRGEYHVGNVTTYDREPEPSQDAAADDKMDTDDGEPRPPASQTKLANGSAANAKKQQPEPLTPGQLYPIFWSLQESFSQPKKLFDTSHFAQFRTGFEATMAVFRSIQNQQGSRQSRSSDDAARRGLKRKRQDQPDDGADSAFNPKYLTSRDLFELEISDLSFRRYVLVQGMIIMDFLLSLTAKSKEKLSALKTQNSSVIYLDQTLSEEDATWAGNMKKTIATYLKDGAEGPYFCRMVETVLSRDKNWVWWKSKNCKPIEKPALDAASYAEAKQAAQRATTNKRLRPTPMGSLNLDFLEQVDEEAAMERLKAKERHKLPELATFQGLLRDVEFDVSMATDARAKAAAAERKASLTWRALRIAGRTRLARFDKIDDYENIDAVFREESPSGDAETAQDQEADPSDIPEDTTPVVLAGISGSGRTWLVNMLLERHRGVFARAVRHTTRDPREGDLKGHFKHVSLQEFNVMLDGDRFVEHETVGGHEYGTSNTAVGDITDSGKVPLVEVGIEGAQYLRDAGVSCRIVSVKPPGRDVLKDRLEAGGRPGDDVAAVLKEWDDHEKAPAATQGDIEVMNADLEQAVQAVEAFIYKSRGGDGIKQ